MLDDPHVTDEADILELPAPRSALSHVNQTADALPWPHEPEQDRA